MLNYKHNLALIASGSYLIGVYVLLMIILLCNHESYGLDDSKVSASYSNFKNLAISSKGINRINFGNRRIDKIIGNNSEFTAVVSEGGENLFLTSKVVVGSNINMSVQFLDGKGVDISFKVLDKKLPSLIDVSFNEPLALDSLRQESEEMIIAMMAGKRGKYYVQAANNRFKLPDNADIEFRQINSYRYGKLKGAKYIVTNKGRFSKTRVNIESNIGSNIESNAAVINSGEISRLFANVISSVVTNEYIGSLQQATIYIVFDDDKGGV